MSLSISHVEITGKAGLKPFLLITVAVENDLEYEIEVWSYNPKVTITCPSSAGSSTLTLPAIIEDFGALQRVEPVTSARRSLHRYELKMQIPLDWSDIYAIERVRGGHGGVRIILDCQVLILYQGKPGQQQQRLFDRLSRQGSSPVSEDVSQEQWLAILKDVGYRDYMIVEVPVEAIRSNPKLLEAWKLLESARARYEHGDDPGVLEACFKALDSVALHFGANAGHASAFEEILKPNLQHDLKARRAGELIHSIRAYSDRGRQSQASPDRTEIPVSHRDAEYVLMLTRVTLAYMANILS